MRTNPKLIIFLCLCSGGILWAQDAGIAKIPPTDAIQSYLSATKEYTALFSGKTELPYDRPFVNHPYLETDRYVQGTLCYNKVVYQDIYMRLDLFRNELTVFSPDKPYRIVLENEKFNYAVLHGLTLILSANEVKTGLKYMVLIDDGLYPFVKQYRLSVREEYSGVTLFRSFRIQEQYFIYINDMAYPVKNKNALLKLFPDRKKELNEYAKQHKLNFKAQFEQAIIALINHYENLTSRKHADETI